MVHSGNRESLAVGHLHCLAPEKPPASDNHTGPAKHFFFLMPSQPQADTMSDTPVLHLMLHYPLLKATWPQVPGAGTGPCLPQDGQFLAPVLFNGETEAERRELGLG